MKQKSKAAGRGQPVREVTDAGAARLWEILEEIDKISILRTDAAFRLIVKRKVEERHDVFVTDGHRLFKPKEEIQAPAMRVPKGKL